MLLALITRHYYLFCTFSFRLLCESKNIYTFDTLIEMCILI